MNGITIPVSRETTTTTTTTRGHGHLSAEREEVVVPLSEKREKKKYNSLWTKKFGKRKITGNRDLRNVLNYIHTNRKKHNLPENKELQTIIEQMTCTTEYAFRTEYK